MASAASVVICTYNRADLLGECLNALNKQTLSRKRYEILVVENSADHTTYEAKREKYAKQTDRFLRSLPPGLSRARNVGWREASSEIVVYLDDDAVPDEGWLEQLIKPYANNEVGCVGGRVIPLFPGKAPNWLTTELLDYLSVVDYGESTMTLSKEKWLVGANISFRRTFLEQYGGFPESLGRVGNTNSLLSNDETPLLDQLRELRSKIVYCGSAKVSHFIEPDRLSKEWFRRRVTWQAISDVLKGDRLSSESTAQIANQYRELALEGKIVGRSLFGLMTKDITKETFPGEFANELGFLYQCVRYLVETGSKI